MIFQKRMDTADANDSSLVAASLAGNREAFGEIVSRYQSLVCSLAYSATGSLAQSEDLAQETFLTAWKQLKQLHDPQKLRSWLCGIARNIINNFLRRQGREPVRHAQPLDQAGELPAADAATEEQIIKREEEAILWRSLERIPDLYREPLVLFYREGESVERVAAQLELSEDAVKQRLSRGRKLLADEVSLFVEGALKQSRPGRAFTIGVLSALPAFTGSATAAMIGTTAAKGSTTAKAAGIGGLISGLLVPVLAFLGTWAGYRVSLDVANSEAERAHIKSFYRRLIASIIGFGVAITLLMSFAKILHRASPSLFVGLVVTVGVAYLSVISALTVWSFRVRRHWKSAVPFHQNGAAYEFRSSTEFLGLPLVHFSMQNLGGKKQAVKAWVAFGDCAISPFLAVGGLAIAPISIGGCAVGLLSFGGASVGMIALGGLSVGVWSIGGMGFGWQAFAGCAAAWNAAVGGTAVAWDYALGGLAHAAEANNSVASAYIKGQPFFKAGQTVMRHLFWMHLLWVAPMIWWWRIIRRKRSAMK